MLSIEVSYNEVRNALQALANKARDLSPVLRIIGEGVADRTQQRFGTSTGPDGQRWVGNSDAVLRQLLLSKKGSFTKKGGLSKAGTKTLAGKKPLVATGELAHSIRYQVSGNSVEIGTNRFADTILNGAAIHQFGGMAGKGRSVRIPARPFLPLTQDGQLYPGEQAAVLEAIHDYLAGQ